MTDIHDSIIEFYITYLFNEIVYNIFIVSFGHHPWYKSVSNNLS